MTPTGAFVSLDEIINAWLFKNGKTIHNYAKVLTFAAEAVREMSYTSMQIVNNVILEREDDQQWFTLPDDYSDWCAVGIRVGSYWRPLGVETGILPQPYFDGLGAYTEDQFSQVPGQMNTTGNWTNWVGSTGGVADDFWDEDFLIDDFAAQARTSPILPPVAVSNSSITNTYLPYQGYMPFFFSDLYNDWGQQKGRYFGFGDGNRVDSVNINEQQGIIMVPLGFPGKFLFLSYVGIGNVDSMSFIPKKAQTAIEAYITYKMALVKRNSLQEAGLKKQLFDQELKLFRSKNNTMSITDVKRSVQKAFGRTRE
jgi:hypothetical protein